MTEDFNNNALPTESGSFFRTDSAARIHMDSWYEISVVIRDLFDSCVEGRGMPGWANVAGNVIVAFWPRSSLTNQRYGLNARATLDMSNSSVLLQTLRNENAKSKEESPMS